MSLFYHIFFVSIFRYLSTLSFYNERQITTIRYKLIPHPETLTMLYTAIDVMQTIRFL